MALSTTPAERIRVLVAEDEALLLFTIADDLRAAGYEVLEATSSAAALRLLEGEQALDVLFTDVDMPGPMNGLQLAYAIRGRWPAARIIVTSGHVRLADTDLPPGGRFVAKPYTPAMIVNLIEASAA